MGAVLLLAAVAAAATPLPRATKKILFQGTFDSSGTQLKAEVGKFYAFLSDTKAVKIAPSISGTGNALVFDDTYTPIGVPNAIAGQFDQGIAVQAGKFEFKHTLIVGQANVPFSSGLVIDLPTSDYVPQTGPDGSGGMLVMGKPTTYSVPVGTPMTITSILSRPVNGADWNYEVSILPEPSGPDTPPAGHFDGTLENTANKAIIGIAFSKSAGAAGIVAIDQIEASLHTPVAGGVAIH